MQQITAEHSVGNDTNADYNAYLHRIQQRFIDNVKSGIEPLFQTNVESLWLAYLDEFSAEDRQYHTCHACKQFIERFGGLVTINARGETAPAIWNVEDAPEAYKPAIAAMIKLIRRAKVTGPFLSSELTWGSPTTGIWTHPSVTPLANMLFRRTALKTAGQAMAEKREDFGTVHRALSEFTAATVQQALTLLKTDALYRSEKVLGQTQWLADIHAAHDAAPKTMRDNITWRAIATAPAGFCHPRSSMVGTLLEDIASGMDFAQVSKRFADKMHPLQYQRPQAAPTSGAIQAAEKAIAALGAAGALARRFCRLDELITVWRPAPTKADESVGGVFGHLKAKDAAPVNAPLIAPATAITWEKFARTVLPDAQHIEYFSTFGPQSLGAFVTAVNPDAPTILQWDRDEQRNPVSWYVWHGGSSAASFGIAAGAWVTLDAITLKPSMWHDPEGKFAHQGKGIVLVITGARETKQAGNALFPEILKAEYHSVRSVLESFARSATIEGMDHPHVAGLMLLDTKGWNARIRVTSNGQKVEYLLDRWD